MTEGSISCKFESKEFKSGYEISKHSYVWNVTHFEDHIKNLSQGKEGDELLESPEICIQGIFSDQLLKFKLSLLCKHLFLCDNEDRDLRPNALAIGLRRIDGEFPIYIKCYLSYQRFVNYKDVKFPGFFEKLTERRVKNVGYTENFLDEMNIYLNGSIDVYANIFLRYRPKRKIIAAEDSNSYFKALKKVTRPTDSTLIGTKWEFPVHHDILAKYGEFWEGFFHYNDPCQGKKRKIDLNIKKETMEDILNYIYSEEAKVLPNEMDPLIDLLSVSDRFNMAALKLDIEINLIAGNLTKLTAAKLLSKALTYNGEKLKDAAKDVIFRNLSQICCTKEFADLVRVYPEALMDTSRK